MRAEIIILTSSWQRELPHLNEQVNHFSNYTTSQNKLSMKSMFPRSKEKELGTNVRISYGASTSFTTRWATLQMDRALKYHTWYVDGYNQC